MALAWNVIGTIAGVLLLALFGLGEWPYVYAGWFALVPWLIVWSRCRTIKELFLFAGGGAAAFVALVFPWFAVAVSAYTGSSILLATIVLIAASAFLEPQFLVLALVWYGLRRDPSFTTNMAPPTLALVGAAAYVACEGTAPTKILADTLGLGLWPVLQWVQAADVGGVYLLTFALVFANACIACGLEDLVCARRYPKAVGSFALAGATAVSLWLYGDWRLEGLAGAGLKADPPRAVRIGAVQGNISHYDRLREQLGTFGAVRYLLDRYFHLTRTLPAEIDLWAWPETVYPTTFAKPKSPEGALFDREIAAFVQVHERPLIFGAYDRDDRREYNAAFVLLPEVETGLRVKVQRKLHPFPFTEYVPEWLDSPQLRRRFPWLGTWSPGTKLEVMEIPGRDGTRFRVAALICYDAVLPKPARTAADRGADVLLSLSNDSWFEGEAGKRWALVASAFRSIETRKPQVRITPTGISAVVEPSGRANVLVPPGREGVGVARVELGSAEPTLVVRWGDWVVWGSVVGVVFLGIAWWIQRQLRSRSKPPESSRR